MTAQADLALHALRSRTLRRISGAVLIACCARKAPATAYASELYQGALFRASVRYAQALGLPWAVLSAEYGLVLPTDVIAPYDRRITDLRPTKRAVWGQQCVIDLFKRIGHPRRAILLAGRDYREHVEPQLHRRGVPEVVVPLEGLAIGQQRQRLAQMTAAAQAYAAQAVPFERLRPDQQCLLRQYRATHEAADIDHPVYCDACGFAIDGDPLHFSGSLDGVSTGHIHLCASCAEPMPRIVVQDGRAEEAT